MKPFYAALGLIAFSVGLLGAETVLTVDKAVETALARNISVERSKIAYDALGRKASTAWNVFVPSLDAGAGVSRSSATDVKSYYGSVSASLGISPSVIKSIEKAKLDYEAGRITRETAIRDVELSVRKAFYTLIYERENAALIEATVATARKQYEQTLEKQRAGLVPEVDLLSAQVTLENLKPDLESAKNALTNDTASFKRLVGIEQIEEISLEGSLDDALALGDIDLTGVNAVSPSVAKLEKSLEVAKVQKDITAVGLRTPTLSLGYAYKPSKTDVEGSEWEDAGSVSASVTFALDGFLPFSSDAETIRAAKDTVRDTELALADARVSERLERETLLRTIENSRASIQARALGVTLAERNYALTEDAYRHGTKDILSLQDAADSLEEARVSLKKGEYTLIAAVLELEYAVGVPFGTLGR